jgi:hypothetical protein
MSIVEMVPITLYNAQLCCSGPVLCYINRLCKMREISNNSNSSVKMQVL